MKIEKVDITVRSADYDGTRNAWVPNNGTDRIVRTRPIDSAPLPSSSCFFDLYILLERAKVHAHKTHNKVPFIVSDGEIVAFW